MFERELDALLKNVETSPRISPTTALEGYADIFIYGAGNIGKDMLKALEKLNLPVTAFLDRSADGSSLKTIPILKPGDDTITADQRRRSLVIVAIFNWEAEIPPILDLLHALGYGKIITFIEFHDLFPSAFGDRFWLTNRHFYLDKRDPILATLDLWEDESSRTLFQSVLRFRLSMDYRVLPAPDAFSQYFPANIPAWPDRLRFVDCGAFDGDTLRSLERTDLSMEAIAAFEPDPKNFSNLISKTKSLMKQKETVVCLFPCGVHARTTQVRFAGGKGEGSCSSSEGETMIQCVSLDEALPSFRPSLIKMDIEGMEYEALEGARQIISENRPGLAICVYHRPEHLWTIPLLIQGWLKGGRHYLRVHTHSTFELVYYWVP